MADPVSATIIGAGALAGGTGNLIANLDQADAERRNADWFDEQARFARRAGDLEYAVRSDQLREFKGQQVTAMAGSGFSFEAEEGRALMETDRKIERELAAIQAQSEMNVREALLRGQDARGKASRLGSFGVNALQFGGSLLGGAGNILRSK